MSEDPVTHAPDDAPEPGPTKRAASLSLEAYVEQQEADLAVSAPTMAEWLARMHALDWGNVDSDSMIADIRRWRDREAG